ncbi:MAG TPA: hypothetical protein PKG54_19820, partial [Phycisphaerae bacterium]|nr:hypothetical protein [Phycisphaerae bacterium]
MQRHIYQLSIWPLAAGALFVLAACLQAQIRVPAPPPMFGSMSLETCETNPPGFLPFWENDPAVLTAKLLGGSPPSGVTITQTQLIGGNAIPGLRGCFKTMVTTPACPRQ